MKTQSLRLGWLAPLLLLLVGCGSLLFPDRRGQGRGDVDPNVALMDGFLLLFYVFPGVIAFVVDYSTGALYLPPGSDGEGPFFGDDTIFDVKETAPATGQ